MYHHPLTLRLDTLRDELMLSGGLLVVMTLMLCMMPIMTVMKLHYGVMLRVVSHPGSEKLMMILIPPALSVPSVRRGSKRFLMS